MTRLNLGCGGVVADGWVNIDRSYPPHDVTLDETGLQAWDPEWRKDERFVLLDLAYSALPCPDRSCEGAVAHHVLDLLRVDEVYDLFSELHRALALGAVFRVSCADVARGIEEAMAGNVDWFPEPCWTSDFQVEVGRNPYDPENVNLEATLGHFILQGGARQTLVTRPFLEHIAERTGWPHVYESAFGRTMGPNWITELDSRYEESFFMEFVR